MTKTLEKIREIFEHHLPYEIDRLAETYGLLNDASELRRGLSQATCDTVADSLIVAFCVHGKALIEFLSKSDGESYASSTDYADNYQSWKIAHGSREHSIRGKLNNQLSHLTFGRTAVNPEKIGPEDRTFIVQKIKSELERWTPCLRAEYNAKLLPIVRLKPVLTLKMPAALSVTNHTSSSIGWTGPSGPMNAK
jgi:hypothetical protein